MAAKKVQGYLDHHRIGPLFEDLMAKLIKDKPDQPIPFLIKTLKKLHPEDITHSIPRSRPPSGSKLKSPVSSSIGLTGKTMTRHSFDDSSSRRSALAKSWAAPDSFSDTHHGHPVSASKATREYNRPWLTGSKKVKPGEDHAHSNKENTRQGFKTQKTNEKVPWNSKTKLSSHGFDEMFELQNKMAKSQETKAKEYHGAQSWEDSQDFDSSLDKRGLGYPLDVKRKTLEPSDVMTDDGLEGEEFRLPRDVKTAGDSSEGNSVMSSYSSLRSNRNKAKSAAEEHRKHLQSLLQNTTGNCQSDHHSKLTDDDMDDATEILESFNELESEGVANPSKTGARLLKSSRMGSLSQEAVKVSICARCARIISGLQSDQRSDAGSTSFNSAGDEDFESVSQAESVTDGPRRITWPSGFDSESEATTKKGIPMWQTSSPQPDKGKHMYKNSTFLTDLAPSPRRPPSASTDDVSDDGLFSKPTETNFQRAGSPDLSAGRPWTRPPPDSASEAGSVDWIQDRNKKRGGFESRGFRRSDMTDDSDQ
ncbi:uncharacterized protein C8orf34 homolog isoform X2 [Actinia tenebrosa]|uniref:Uncharacterized protein C8orf34 homolog isoform X2 n=1 Tax=Actinia tenebrosa TaxID=6105 RepID=A0A6P8I1V5_ACTTE|nr:uncharacterized protein C8orf34 homolog isoform X2 [Actinia tenebrosa]